MIREGSIHEVLELGTGTGYSTLWLAQALSEVGGHIDTVEHRPDFQAHAKRRAELFDLSSCITFHEMRIEEFFNIRTISEVPSSPSSQSTRLGSRKKTNKKDVLDPRLHEDDRTSIDPELLYNYGPNTYDLIFIDARKTSYLKYLKEALTYLNTGGVIVLDDVIKYRDKMSDLFPYIEGLSDQYTSVTLPIEGDDGILILKKLSKI